MKNLFKISVVLFLFSSCNERGMNGELEKYKQQSKLDSLKIAELDLKYNSALNDIQKLGGQNHYLDSCLFICREAKKK